jgi:hypothetical protein
MKLEIAARLPSYNDFYAGMHYTKRVKLKNMWRLLVLESLPLEYEMFAVPVDIWVYAEYKNNPCDSDNLADKLIIDGLKGKVLKDDNNKWVQWTCTMGRAGERDYVTVEIVESE